MSAPLFQHRHYVEIAQIIASLPADCYGVEQIALHFAELQNAWAARHPAWLLARTLPEGDAKRFILKAVQSRLGAEA